MASYTARTTLTTLGQHLKFSHLIGLRLIAPFIVYFFLSLAYALLNKFFLVPFDRYFGSAGFVIVWMVFWVGMLVLYVPLHVIPEVCASTELDLQRSNC
jgi:hypothetical protein